MEKKILIVDDKKVNRFILDGIFEDEYQVLEAEEGNQAIGIIEEEQDKISAILLDLIMPQADGFTVLEYMKARRLLERIPVILVTVKDSEDIINKVYEYQVADFIQKPFQENVIKRRVSRVISSYGKRLLEV